MRGECDVKEVKVPEAHFTTQGVSSRRDVDYEQDNTLDASGFGCSKVAVQLVRGMLLPGQDSILKNNDVQIECFELFLMSQK